MLRDWLAISRPTHSASAVVDPRRRMRGATIAFLLLLTLVFLRATQREVTEGAAFRAEALRPVRHEHDLPAPRGRILARDGAELACDREVVSLAVQYRWLEEPPDARWLRQTVRQRLKPAQRRDARKRAEAESQLIAGRAELHRRLAALCGMTPDDWQTRAAAVQNKVERIAASVRRRKEAVVPKAPVSAGGSFFARLLDELWQAWEAAIDDSTLEPIIVAEELAPHVMADDVSPEVVAEIDAHPDHWPGVSIPHGSRRVYRHGMLASHLLGYVGRSESSAYTGRVGIEVQCEGQLAGRPGREIELTNHSGHLLERITEQGSIPGRDVMLTLDVRLQQTAEELLASALARRAVQADVPPSGGAIVVLDVHTGEVLAAASAPRFDPDAFVRGDAARLAPLLAAPDHPLFDRVIKMALPPGSVFKTLTAAALLETSGFDPQEPYLCRGYLSNPNRQRCELFIRRGVGHGDVHLTDALAQSCNVYFFHHAAELGPVPLVAWARRFGFGRPTGIDLPGEAAGTLPSPENIQKLEGHAWRVSDTQAMAIGQGSLTATPLQVARMMAAIGNGGRLVTPHLVKDAGPQVSATTAPVEIGLRSATLAAVRTGLEAVVADAEGSAHAALWLPNLSVAGKTGTAEVGDERPAHAWFAGYAPAAEPKVAFVVVLEQAGDAATAAAPVAKHLLLKLAELGYVR